MATVTLKGTPFHTNKEPPQVGSKAPSFTVVSADLKDISLETYKGKKKVIYTVPSLDTEVCSISTQRFNTLASEHKNVVFLTISCDLPFAQKRFCSTHSVDNVHTLSMMRNKQFAEDYGLLLVDGPLAGLCSRSVFVLGEDDKILHVELVKEVTHEPDYDKVVSKL